MSDILPFDSMFVLGLGLLALYIYLLRFRLQKNKSCNEGKFTRIFRVTVLQCVSNFNST